MQTLKEWRRYRVKLQDYANLIETARCFYRDTLDELWSEIVDSEEALRALEADPGGLEWKSPLYDRRLRLRLGYSYDSYVQNVVTINEKLQLLCQSLSIEKGGKAQWSDFSSLKRQLMRIKLTVKSNVHKQTLDEIEKANFLIREFTHQSRHLEPLRNGRRGKRLMAEFRAIQEAALSLYNAFLSEERWSCVCRERHFVTMRLEQRLTSAASDNSRHSFRILCVNSYGKMGLPSTFQRHEMKQLDVVSTTMVQQTVPLASTKEKKMVQFNTTLSIDDSFTDDTKFQSLVPIIDICRNSNYIHDTNNGIGYLLETQGRRKHCIFRSELANGQSGQFQSLSDVLKNGENQISFYRGDRLRIAVILASSVLQLNGTPWLSSKWTSEDINFSQPRADHSNSPVAHPYVPWRCCAGKQSVPPKPQSSFVNDRRHPMLLSLGLTLVELCFGKTLAALHSDEDGGLDEPLTKVYTATRLLRTINREMGDLYSNAVRRCILQPFDVLDIDLNDEEVQQKVYEDIISPLTESLEAFSGHTKLC